MEWNNEKVPEKPEYMDRIPFIRGMTFNAPVGSSSQSVQAFYRNLDEVKRVDATYNNMKGKERAEFGKENREKINLYNTLEGAEKKMSRIRKQINGIYENIGMSGKQKADRITRLERQMTDIAFEANEAYNKRKENR